MTGAARCRGRSRSGASDRRPPVGAVNGRPIQRSSWAASRLRIRRTSKNGWGGGWGMGTQASAYAPTALLSLGFIILPNYRSERRTALFVKIRRDSAVRPLRGPSNTSPDCSGTPQPSPAIPPRIVDATRRAVVDARARDGRPVDRCRCFFDPRFHTGVWLLAPTTTGFGTPVPERFDAPGERPSVADRFRADAIAERDDIFIRVGRRYGRRLRRVWFRCLRRGSTYPRRRSFGT